MKQDRYKLIRKTFKISQKGLKRFLTRYSYIRKNNLLGNNVPYSMWSRKRPGEYFLKQFEENIDLHRKSALKIKGRHISGSSIFHFINEMKFSAAAQQRVEYFFAGLILKQPQALEIYWKAYYGAITWEEAERRLIKLANEIDEYDDSVGTPTYIDIDFNDDDDTDPSQQFGTDEEKEQYYSNIKVLKFDPKALPITLIARTHFLRSRFNYLEKRNRWRVKKINKVTLSYF